MFRKTVRRLRIIEYVGSEEWVNRQIEQRQLKGTKSMAEGSIREAFLGDTNEVLLDAEILNIEAERKSKSL